jgi:hypothetical protein
MSEWLAGVPLVWGKVIAIIAFVGIAVWAWLRPGSYIFQGAPDSCKWRDLRVWASLLMAIQVVIYLSF